MPFEPSSKKSLNCSRYLHGCLQGSHQNHWQEHSVIPKCEVHDPTDSKGICPCGCSSLLIIPACCNLTGLIYIFVRLIEVFLKTTTWMNISINPDQNDHIKVVWSGKTWVKSLSVNFKTILNFIDSGTFKLMLLFFSNMIKSDFVWMFTIFAFFFCKEKIFRLFKFRNCS